MNRLAHRPAIDLSPKLRSLASERHVNDEALFEFGQQLAQDMSQAHHPVGMPRLRPYMSKQVCVAFEIEPDSGDFVELSLRAILYWSTGRPRPMKLELALPSEPMPEEIVKSRGN